MLAIMWVVIAIFTILVLWWYIGPWAPTQIRLKRDDMKTLAIPFRIDRNNIPTIDIKVGDVTRRVVIDTGSSDLVIKANLPTSNECTTLVYGTQQDSGCYGRHVVAMSGYQVTMNKKMNISSTPATLSIPMTLFISSRRSQSPYNNHAPSNYDILGLSAYGAHSAISQLLPEESHGKFTIMNDGRKQYILFAPLPLDYHTLPPAPTDGYFGVALDSLEWGQERKSVSTLVVDSGSNKVFIPSHLWTPAMTQAQKDRKDLTFHFPLVSTTLVVPGSAVKKYVMTYESYDDHIVLGVLILRAVTIEFNILTKEVRLSA
jgi:hypothetical protein